VAGSISKCAATECRACVNHRAPELVTTLSPSSHHAFERGVAVAQPTRNAPDRPLPASRARATLV
jgi:hypothetical protein